MHLHAAGIDKAEFDSTLEKEKTNVAEVRLIEGKFL